MTPSPAARVLLLGDSHLARLGPGAPDLGTALSALPGPMTEVVNLARGGSSALDLAGQVGRAVPRIAAGAGAVAVLSVGTNDAAPWKRVPLADCVAAVGTALDALPCRVVLLAPPGVDEGRLTRVEDRTHAVLDDYRDALRSVVLDRDGRVVEARQLLEPLGPEAFVADGVHLTPAAYALLLPALAEAVAALLGRLRSSAGAPRS